MQTQETNSTQSSASPPPLALADRVPYYYAQALQWIWSTTPAQGRLAPLFQNFLKIILIFLKECQRDKIGLRSSALTFTVVLSLVPTLALGTAVLKGFGAGNQMREAAYKFIDRLDLTAESTPSFIPQSESPAPQNGNQTLQGEPSGESTPATATPGDSLSGHLRKAVDQIFDYVDRTNFARLGAFGIAGLLFAVISVLGSIEQSMNNIWQAESNRPFARRIMDYLALMILLPISINLALATETIIQSPEILTRMEFFFPLTGITSFFLKLLPMFAVAGSFSLLYAFLPNTRTRLVPILVGGIIGGISWVLIQTLFIKMQIGVAKYNAIYGSFATLPLFLLWIYIGWLVFLGGAEIAFSVQTWRSYTWHEIPMSPASKLSIAFDTIATVHEDFRHRSVTDHVGLAMRLNQPPKAVNLVLDQLLTAGVIRHVDGGQSGYVPGAPEDELKAEEVIELILGPESIGRKHNPLAASAIKGAKTAVMGKKVIDSA